MEEYYKNLSLEDLPNEEWRDIEGASFYRVSNFGRVKSLSRKTKRGSGYAIKGERILSPVTRRGGYTQAMIFFDNGVAKAVMIHQLVLKAFVPNPDNYHGCDHINTIRNDNRAENLRWADAKLNMSNPITKENRKRAIQTYTHNEDFIKKQRESQPHSKIVQKYTLGGELLEEYYSISEAARSVGGIVQAISRCCNGKVKTSYGYIWRFKEETLNKE